MENAKTYLAPLGRLLMSSLFLWAGINKLMSPGGTAQYFAAVNVPVPEVAVWVVIIIEIVGGLAILLGYKIRWAAAVLAIFCLVTGIFVHLAAAMSAQDAMAKLGQMTNFYKNLVMAGGFLYVWAFGAGALSIEKD